MQTVQSSEMFVDSLELLRVLILLNFEVEISMKQELAIAVDLNQLIIKTVQ